MMGSGPVRGARVVLLLAATIAPRPSLAQDSAGYADAIASYRAGRAEHAVQLMSRLENRRVWDEANRLARDPDRTADGWLARARAALVLHTELWLNEGGAGLLMPRNLQFDCARTIAGALMTASRDPGSPSGDVDFVRDWYLLAAAFLQGQASVGKSGQLLAEARRLFPADSRLLLASGSDHEILSQTSPGRVEYYDLTGRHRTIDRVDVAREREQAVTFFREALRLEPGLVEARLRLGRVLYQLGQMDAAATELQATRQKTDRAHVDYLAALFLGVLETSRGRYPRAGQLYREAAAIYPAAQAARIGLSEIAYLEGRHTDAASIVRTLLEVDKKEDPWWPYLAGEWWHFEARLTALRARAQQ